MPTKRTIEQLYELFEPGQPDRSITPDRVQDLILTLLGGYGRISGNGSTPFTLSQNDWAVVDVVTTLATGARQFSMPQNGRLQCDCPVPSLMVNTGFLTLQANQAAVFEIALGRNGVVDSNSISAFRLPPGGGSGTVPLHNDFLQEQNDYVEVFIRRTDGSANPSVTHYLLSGQTFTQ
jgi:hypothetical protein